MHHSNRRAGPGRRHPRLAGLATAAGAARGAGSGRSHARLFASRSRVRDRTMFVDGARPPTPSARVAGRRAVHRRRRSRRRRDADGRVHRNSDRAVDVPPATATTRAVDETTASACRSPTRSRRDLRPGRQRQADGGSGRRSSAAGRATTPPTATAATTWRSWATATTCSSGTRATAATASRARPASTRCSSTGPGPTRCSRRSANGPRLRFTRNVGNIVMDTDGVERVDVEGPRRGRHGDPQRPDRHRRAGVRVDLEAVKGGGAADDKVDG